MNKSYIVVYEFVTCPQETTVINMYDCLLFFKFKKLRLQIMDFC